MWGIKQRHNLIEIFNRIFKLFKQVTLYKLKNLSNPLGISLKPVIKSYGKLIILEFETLIGWDLGYEKK